MKICIICMFTDIQKLKFKNKLSRQGAYDELNKLCYLNNIKNEIKIHSLMWHNMEYYYGRDFIRTLMENTDSWREHESMHNENI